jgi:hypothetical protein
MPTFAQPDCTVALHVRASNAETPPFSATYTVWVDWLTTMSPGPLPTVTVGGVCVEHPARSVALHVDESIIETVSALNVGPGLATYTVWFAESAKIPKGNDPTRTLAGLWSQPDVTRPLQVAPLKTATVSFPLSPSTVTYTVSVIWSTVIVDGRFPTLIVGHGPLHCETSWA